nr:MAG TPA: hypothetical protein [Caudoviricetes sp.]
MNGRGSEYVLTERNGYQREPRSTPESLFFGVLPPQIGV